MRIVEVTDHQPSWKERFKEEAARLKQILQEDTIDIHHIGSTSVPGLAAKPVIDLLIVLRQVEDADKQVKAMEWLGYIARGENGIAGRRFFQKGGDERTHHVHIFGIGHKAIKEHLLFRDYLRTHTDAAQAYGELKTKLATEHRLNVDAYIVGKAAWIQATKCRSEEWAKENGCLYE